MSKAAIFADYIVTPGMTGTNHFETAAWFETVALSPGEYPIEGDFGVDGELADGTGFKIPGTIVKDSFQSLFCGNAVGEAYDREQNVGKSAVWRGYMNGYVLARKLLRGEQSNICLRPGYEARETHFEYDGETHASYGIFKTK